MNNWWALLVSLLCVGTVATHVLPEGKTYEYEYRMVVLNGIPELNQQYAVHGLKCDVQVHSVNGKKLLMQIKNVQVAKENKIFAELSPEEIDLRLSSNSAYQNLSKPFLVEYENDGTVKDLHFQPSDPEWSRHWKTGLATMAQIKKLSSAVESNKFSRGSSEDNDIGTVDEQMEPTPSGICNSIYSYQLSTSSSGKDQSQEMIIDKVRDYHDCKHKPYYATSSLRRFKCDDCQSDDSHPIHQNDVCKYNVTVTSSDDYVIQQAICDGIITIRPLGQDADSLTVIHNRTLELKRMRSIDENARKSLSNFNWETEKPYSNLTDKLVNIRNPESLNDPIHYQEISEYGYSLKEPTHRLLRQYVELIKKPQISVEESKQILDYIPLIQRGLTTLNYEELKQLSREFSSDSVAKKTFYDYLSITATNPCIKMIMESYKSKMLTPEETVTLLPKIAGHVLNPNTLLCDKMLEFCLSSEVQNHEQMSVTCYLSLGSVVAKSVAKDQYQIPKTRESYFPREKRQHYVKALQQQLENTDDELQQAALLQALGNTALEEALPAIEPYIRASDDIPKVVQVKAIYSLLALSKMNPDLVREPLVSVLFNGGENTQARIAAFNLLVVSRPRRHLYEKIAAMTQYGDDTVLNVYIYSSFQALANASLPCLADASSHAQHAVDLMDEEYDASAWIASNTVWEGDMEYLDADAFLRLASLGDAGSMTPSMLYVQVQDYVSNYAAPIFSAAMYGNNTSYLLDTLIGASAIFEDRSLYESINLLNKPLKNLGLQDLSEQVGFTPRKQPEFSAMISTRFMEFQQRLHRVDKDVLRKLLLKTLGGRSEQGSGNYHFTVDAHTTKMPVDVKIFMHIDSGYMFRINVQTPIHMSVRGELKINPKPTFKSMNVDVDARIKVHVSARSLIHASILVPEDKVTAIGTGYETTAIAAPLISGKINMELQKKKLSIKCKASDSTSSSGGEQEIAHYHTRPFTAINPLWRLQRLSEVTKTIHNEVRPTRNTVQVFGNSLVLKLEDEQYWDDSASIYKYFEENSILGIAVNGWMAHQWTPREYSLIWKNSQLPELAYEMEWEYKPAPADPSKHIDSFVYVLWRQLFGVSDVPMRCQSSDSSSNDKSDSGSSEGSSSREGPRYRSNHESTSQSDESSSSEKPDFSHFNHKVDNKGRWWGWKSDSSYGDDDDDSNESAQPRWALGWMMESDDGIDNYSSSNERGGSKKHKSKKSTDYSSRSSESREYSTRGRSGQGNSPQTDSNLKIEQASLTEGVAVYIVRAEAKIKSDTEKGLKVEVVMKKPRSQPDASIDILVKTTGSLEKKMVCLKAKYSGERAPCFLSRSQQSFKDAVIRLNATLNWGTTSCTEPEGYLDVSFKARKSREQLNMQKSDRPYFYDQCKEDKENDNHYSHACRDRLEHESRLNFLSTTIKYNRISSKVYNFTEKVQDLIIYNLYPHLSHDSLAKNPSNQIKVSVNFHPNIPVVDVQIKRPQETLKFNKIFYGDVEPFVAPPSIIKSYGKSIVDYYTDKDVTPYCAVTDNYVKNLQNDTFDFDGRDSCQYLVTGDCGPSNMFYVLIRNNSKESHDNSKTLTVQLLKNLIEINPKARRVTINNKQIEMKEESITFLKDESYGPTLLGYIIKADNLYKVVLTFNRVSIVFDGVDVVVRTSTIWRKKLCGICGEYNPEDDEPYTGPRQCQYSIPNDFAESYALRSDQCPKARVEGEKSCDSGESSFRHIPSQGSCSIERPLVKRLGSGKKVCGSIDTYKTCKSGCEATETENVNVPFKCVRFDDKLAHELMENNDKWIQYAQHGAEDFTADVEVPVSCSPRS